MRRLSTFALAAFSLSLLMFAAPAAHAAITGHIDADITHPFTIVNTTLPPGHYVFRMEPATDLQIMTLTNASGDTSVAFMVRPLIDNHVPKHSELVFNRYGHREFLEKIFEMGHKTGVAVIEPSHEEAQLRKEGQKPFEHTEEQQH